MVVKIPTNLRGFMHNGDAMFSESGRWTDAWEHQDLGSSVSASADNDLLSGRNFATIG